MLANAFTAKVDDDAGELVPEEDEVKQNTILKLIIIIIVER